MSARRRCLAATLTVIALLGTVGCERRTAQSSVPAVVDRPYVPVDAPPDPTLATHPVVAAAKSSVVKIRGLAYRCERLITGTGFVIAPQRVMSNAHVVAGTDQVSVELGGDRYDAQVVSYDPYGDISILDVPGLTAKPLTLADSLAFSGTDAVMLGYPGGGPFAATPARIREVSELGSTDIYGRRPVARQVYTVRGMVTQMSGAPLIDVHAHVLGVVFGAATDDAQTGFVLTSDQIAPQLVKARNSTPVGTGSCLG